MIKLSFCLLALAATAMMTQAESPLVLPLWPDGAPGALGKEDKDMPTLTIYPADAAKASGAAIVILPGGGVLSAATEQRGAA